MMKMFDIIIMIGRSHRNNSEKITKYFPVLYQHYNIQQMYVDISLVNPNFTQENSEVFIQIIGEIFKKT